MIEEKAVIKETMCVAMPQDPELFIAALVVMDKYIAQLKTKNVEVTARLMDVRPDMQFLLQDREWIFSVEELDDLYMYADDFKFIFDEKIAYRISEKTKKHAVEAFSIMLGVDARDSIFPDIKEEYRLHTPSYDILCISSPHADYSDLKSYVAKTPIQESLFVINQGDNSIEDMFKYMMDFKTIIGDRSVYTYLACALGKTVIENYRYTTHPNWLTKWGHEHYFRVFDVDPEGMLNQATLIECLERNKLMTHVNPELPAGPDHCKV